MPDRPTGPDSPGTDGADLGRDQVRGSSESAEQPSLPELRRFRFTDKTRPATTRRPSADDATPNGADTAAPAPTTPDPADLSDTFDVDDLDPHEISTSAFDLDAPAPAFGTAPARPGTGPVRTPPPTASSGPPSGSWPAPAPRTGPFPTPAAPGRPAGRTSRRRTALLAAVAAVVVIAVVAVILIVQPFSGGRSTPDAGPTGTADRTSAAPATATPAPASGSGAGRGGGQSSDTAGVPGASSSWATVVCGSLSSYQADAAQIQSDAESAAAAPTGVAALDELQKQAATLLGTLHTSLSQGGTYDADVQKFRTGLASSALQAQTDVDASQGAQPSGSPQAAKNLIISALGKPLTTFQAQYNQATGQLRADLDAATECATLIR